MMNSSIYIIFFLFVGNSLGDYVLKHVQIIYRHGDRAPVYIYPNDINNITKWPNGLGQLTDNGIRQQYQLGLWLRKRYNKLFGSIIHNSDIYVRSTDYDRCLMSAQANLAGLMLNDSHRIIAAIPWRPIAIHTVRVSTDYLLESNACPRYKVERNDQYNLEYWETKFAPYMSLLLQFQESTGISNITFRSLWKIIDVLFCEKVHNMTLNSWVTKEMWTKLLSINTLTWELMFYKDLAKLTGGRLLYEITDNMRQISLNKRLSKEGFKMIMYSGHDTDLAPLAVLLGFYDYIQPPYSSCIFFELYYDADLTDPWAVKVLYKNDTDSLDFIDIRPQHVTGCNSLLCPLSTFIEVTKTKSLSIDEFMKECALKTSIAKYVKWTFVSICLTTILIILVMFCIRYRQKINIKYTRFDGNDNIN